VGHSFVRLDHPLPVLADISFEIGPGETLAIVGPSGSGKSTLLNLIMGRVKPTHGRVEITASPGVPVRRAVVFQEPTLLPWLSAFDNVRLPLELEGRLDRADDRVRDSLARAGISDFAQFNPAQLSGGMQSRVALARGLVNQPNLLLLDEPFGDLDEATSEEMMIDLAAQLEQDRITAAIVTHSLSQATYLADQVLVLHTRGRGIAASLRLKGPRPRRRGYLDDSAFHTSMQQLRKALREAINAAVH
jgi:ABC-type nitrate/sulfonate/bicarbonate transport system ATPase subunit